MMQLLAVSVGQPRLVQWQGKDILTSIFKSPVVGPVTVRRNNIDGDRQSDLNVHGGLDKAVYAYSHDTYAWWQRELGVESLTFGAFGENLTFDKLDETQIFIGDVFEIGTCVLEVVQPRVPCFRLAIRYGDEKIIKKFYDYGRSGVYFRVKQEGVIQAGDSLRLIDSEPIKASISEMFQFIKDKGVTSKERANELAKIKAMNIKWHDKFVALSKQ